MTSFDYCYINLEMPWSWQEWVMWSRVSEEQEKWFLVIVGSMSLNHIKCFLVKKISDVSLVVKIRLPSIP